MNRNNALTGVILALEAIKVPTTPKSKLKIHPDQLVPQVGHAVKYLSHDNELACTEFPNQ